MGSTPRIGLIGLGNAGQAMLRPLSLRYPMAIHDRDPARCDQSLAACKAPPTVSPSAAALAESAELVILSLPNPAASLSVAGEIRDALSPGTIVVETSTVRPEDIEALHEILGPAGARVIDVALVGGVAKLAEGQAVFLAGMEEAEAGLAGEVLDAMADEIFFLGARGNGMRTKLVVNAVAHAVYVVLVEAGALAAAQDIPLAVLQRLLERESGLARPLSHRFGERLQNHDFDGGMSTLNARKDSRLILDEAHELGVPLFAIPAAHSVYELALREGLGSLDYASIGQLWEKWLEIDFAGMTGGKDETRADDDSG
ncbi:MAG: NAD(P)-dependent oxidoreductase [Novosphingobium sp.]|nr:NAD(P)-dependent oxidoreductase [Novosphingobium sp.]